MNLIPAVFALAVATASYFMWIQILCTCCIMLHHVAFCIIILSFDAPWAAICCHAWCCQLGLDVDQQRRCPQQWSQGIGRGCLGSCAMPMISGVYHGVSLKQLTLQTEILWCEVSACWHAQKLLGGVEHVLYFSSKPGMSMLGKAWAGVPFCLSLTSSNWFS